MKSYIISVFSFLLIFFTISCDENNKNAKSWTIVKGGRAPDTYTGPKTMILEDNVHATKQNTTFQLVENDWLYSHMYAFHRIFNHLNANGYEHDRLTSGKLTPELLANYDIIFLNLMDSTKPDFTQDEIDAVEQWVSDGGGLFVIADHTNVYKHAEKTNPLLAPYGITIRYEIAVDVSPHSVAGLGWILVTDLKDHPVNSGLHEYSLETGGPLDGPGGIGFTSSSGWGDKWNPDMHEGYYGNWSKDPDEVSGPQSVVQAVTYGNGHVFVAGDQNMFGDPYVWFIDNGGLALNAFEWLAHRENEDPPLRKRPVDGLNIHIDTRADQLNMGQSGSSDHYTFFVNLNRVAAINAHASRYPLYFQPDVSMVVEPKQAPDATSLAEMEDVLANNGQVVFIVDPQKISAASKTFLAHWNIDYSLENLQGDKFDITNDSSTIDLLFDVTTTEKMRDNNLVLEECSALQCPGHAILSATSEDEETCDLICEYNLDHGRFLLVLTGQQFRRSTLGDVHDVPYTDHDAGVYSEANYNLELGLTDLLLNY